SVLLRRRKEREGEDRPPAQARLRDGQRLRDPRRLHEQVIEAAVAGELRYLDEQVLPERAADHPFCIPTSRSFEAAYGCVDEARVPTTSEWRVIRPESPSGSPPARPPGDDAPRSRPKLRDVALELNRYARLGAPDDFKQRQ
ncbi:MAG: hypothetical protein JWO48_551, partial [Bryobacterales bacterium]|nr:hypothetical protein [Bryobacterales bacterium]